MKHNSVNETDKHKKMWDEQWSLKQESSSILEKMASIYRRTTISQFVSHYANKYFETNGIYAEAGCGTGEASNRLRKCAFIRIGLDISLEALRRARLQQTYDHYVLADIFNMPFKEESLNGVWNIGVMEHFDYEELSNIFQEYNRVLKPGGCCLLFWPWIFAPSHLIFHLYEIMMHKLGHDTQIFPSAPSMFSNKLQPVLHQINKSSGFAKIRFHFPWLDLTHIAVVVTKR
jgi:SAM-dependent methyltransferase